MTEPERENLKVDFTSVTSSGKKAAAEIANALRQDDPTALQTALQSWLPDVLGLVVDVVISKAKAWEAIDADPNLAFFRELDFKQWFHQDRPEVESNMVQQALVNLEKAQYSMIDKLNTVLTVNHSNDVGTSLSDKDKKKLNVCHHFIAKYGDGLKELHKDHRVCHPDDIAQMTFNELIASNRGAKLVQLLSIPEQPNPELWEHYEGWFLATKVSSSRLRQNYC